MNTRRVVCGLAVLFVLASENAAWAQGYGADARKIGMGGVGDKSNIAASMVAPARPYTAIVLPLGLFQVLKDFEKFDPSSDLFDPARAVENASSPLHFTTGRESTGGGQPEQRFISDLLNGRLNRDLSTYRGFTLPATLAAEGLASGGFGKTIRFKKRSNGAFQGIYVGAGPYVSLATTLGVDPKLTDILGNETATYYPNAAFQVQDDSTLQLAMSIIVGYRARFALPGSSAAGEGARDGVYAAMNYRYLKGFKYLPAQRSRSVRHRSAGPAYAQPSDCAFHG